MSVCAAIAVTTVILGTQGTLASDEAEPPSQGQMEDSLERRTNGDLLVRYDGNSIIQPGDSVAQLAERQRELENQRRELENARKVQKSKQLRSTIAREGRQYSPYPYGWCTYWASIKRGVPAGWGNANQWLKSAREDGWNTGSVPQVGAIVQTSENSLGHVAYVEKVESNRFLISEMSWGSGVVNRRWLAIGSRVIRGYIY
jgi:surface antigen